MQIKKNDIRQRVLSESERLFLEKGFQETSIREIVSASGVSLGNLYRYFNSKDLLFCHVAMPAVQNIRQMLDRHHGVNGVDFVDIMEFDSEGYSNEVIEEYIHLLMANRTSLKLLFFKATGSTLENFRETFINEATEVCKQWYERMKAKHPQVKADVSEFFIHLSSVCLVSVIEEVVMHDLEERQTREVLSHYVRYEILGWKEMVHG